MSGTSMGGMALRTQASIAAPRSHAYPTSRCAVSLATLAVKNVEAAGQLLSAGGSVGGGLDIGAGLPDLAASAAAWGEARYLDRRAGPPRDGGLLQVVSRGWCQAVKRGRGHAKLKTRRGGGAGAAIVPPIPCRPGPAGPCHRRRGGKQGRR